MKRKLDLVAFLGLDGFYNKLIKNQDNINCSLKDLI